MTKYKMYFLHDPVNNIESQITNFEDMDTIQQALNSGMIIIGVAQNGTREIINSIDDIVEPKTATVGEFTVVLPSYVDSKIDELANVIEKLVDALSGSHIKLPIFNNIKESIQKIHDETLKTIEKDKNFIDSSSFITKKEET